MRYRKELLLSLLLFGPAVFAQKIPHVQVESLAGTSIVLPEVLQGKVGVLVIGFSRGSQASVTEWARKLAADFHESPTVLYYEMPVLAGVPKLVRGVVIRQIRSSVPEPAWPRFAPLTEDEKIWRALTHYAAPDEAYVLLVDATGDVRWSTHGPASNAEYGELKQRLATFRP